MVKNLIYSLFALALLLASCAQPHVDQRPVSGRAADDVLGQFEGELELLRQQLKIPGLSAAIVKDQELIWARGFGYADLENEIKATADTPYRLASVTKPIAATLILQLVEEGVITLDDPVSEYGVELESDGVIQVRHLLTHTSEGVPGRFHKYNGDRYSYLGRVVEVASGKSFADLLSERILEPLNMTNTAPSYSECDVQDLVASPETDDRKHNDARVNREVARPYQLDPSYNIVAGAYPAGFSPAAGLISTVVDLAKFDIALDQGILLADATRQQMFEPAVSTYRGRSDLMYGLGWYSQRYQNTRLLWHSGRWSPSVSALYLKVPDEKLTFIVLANTTYLTTPFPLGDGDVLYSTLAHTFYKTFVFPQTVAKAVPQVDWESGERNLVKRLTQVTDEDVREVLERELWSYRQLFASVGRTELVDRLQAVHTRVYGASHTKTLDTYTFRGVEYLPVVSAEVELSEGALARLVGSYTLSDAPQSARGALPAAITIEMKQGKLLGVAPHEGCISLVPITPDLFAIPENPALTVKFHTEGDRVEQLTVEAGGITAVYSPVE